MLEVHIMKWLFFDLGSTLIDETDCIEYRISDLLRQKNAPDRTVIEQKMQAYASQNRLPYKETAEELGLEVIPWPKHLEKLYAEVPEMLEQLSGKYKLGIIANQSLGTEERLKEYGIHHYFDIILSSAEEGIAKPDLQIFQRALQRAGCTPEEACMIGDRLDNDIEPAGRLGMHTIWVKQGTFAYGDLNLILHKPDVMVEHIQDVLGYF